MGIASFILTVGRGRVRDGGPGGQPVVWVGHWESLEPRVTIQGLLAAEAP